jgi:hypothetical protein
VVRVEQWFARAAAFFALPNRVADPDLRCPISDEANATAPAWRIDFILTIVTIARRSVPADSEKPLMQLHLGIAHLQPIVALAAGVLILVRPQFLHYIVAFYLILSGAIGLGFIR